MPVAILRLPGGYWKILYLDPFLGLPKTLKQFLMFGLNYEEIDAILQKHLFISQELCVSLQVTQILIALICFCFGIIVYSMLKISGFEKDFFSSFKAGYPFWGAVFVSIYLRLSLK